MGRLERTGLAGAGVIELSMRLSDAACRDALHGTLSDTAAGAIMHVAIAQGRRSGQVRLLRAPVDAWMALERWCRAEARVLSGDGYNANLRAVRQRRAADRIAAEFDRLAKHPAYRGLAVAGASQVHLPAFRMGPGRWWPTPHLAILGSAGGAQLEMAELVPQETRRDGRVFTEWLVSRPGS